MLIKLIKASKRIGIKLRQPYNRTAKRSLFLQGRYLHTRKYKKAKKEIKKIKIYLGRVYRDILRKYRGNDILLSEYLKVADKLLKQKKDSKNKIYSIHAPEVECISKGKSHKKYEFGNKSGYVTTEKECFVIGAIAFHGNPYDGHTLDESIKQTERLSGSQIKNINVDLGYKGHNYKGSGQVHIVGRHKWKDYKIRKKLGRRASIEPIIGHMKNDGRLGRNFLMGKEGDKINTILAACGQNIRKLLRAIFCFLIKLQFISRNFKLKNNIFIEKLLFQG